ncbi:MAG: single-stranded DNA-binding protein, partial [Cyanobacteria bacterium REEB65]|nr:single-stranded DNA-binding protein [Cyanobacteria bacterium REEB65]
PEIIIIDEIGTEAEALAARTIAERGVQLIGTAHGNSLENLLMNPTLTDLIGGIQSVTLSDEEARRRGTQKSILERKAPPTFDICLELQDRDRIAVHQDVADTVDQMLRGFPPQPEIRQVGAEGEIQVLPPEAPPDLSRAAEAIIGEPTGRIRIFPYAVSRSQLERVIRSMRMPAEVTKNLSDADALVILKAYVKSAGRIIQDAEARQVPTYVVKSNTIPQIQKTLREVMHLDVQYVENEEAALREAREGIDRAMKTGKAVELAPHNATVRRLQHDLIEKYQLRSESVGEEPNRRVAIYPLAVEG